MEDKCKRKFKDLKESDTTYNEQEIILDSYHDSQMVHNAKIINTISFSLQIFNDRSVRQIGSTAPSGGILTLMQQRWKKERAHFSLPLREIYKRVWTVNPRK